MQRAMYRSASEVLYKWKTRNDHGTSGVDLPLDTGSGVALLEVSAKIDPQGKRLNAFVDGFHPALAVSVRSSLSNHRRGGRLLNLPLPAIGNIAFGIARSSETFPE
jgi:hypothetical protein